MQVNNNSQQNFGQLKIMPEAMGALKKKSKAALEVLENVGKDLAENKKVHVVLRGENATPCIVTGYANEYRPPFKALERPEYGPEYFNFSAIWDSDRGCGPKKGDVYKTYISCLNSVVAKKIYAEFATAGTDLEKAAVIAKNLDAEYVRRDALADADRLASEEAEKFVTNLFERFGVKE